MGNGGAAFDVVGRLAPNYQNVLVRAERVLTDDDRVGALVVVGSVGRGEADASSDLDLLLVARDAVAHQSLAGDWRGWLGAIGATVFEQVVVPGLILTVVTGDWCRVDFHVVTNDRLASLTSGPGVVVFDRLGLRPIPRLSWTPPSPAQVEAKVHLVLRSLGLLVTDLARGEYRTLTFATELMIQELIDVMFWAAERPRRTFKRAYIDLPAADVEVLQGLPSAAADPESIIETHMAIARVFLPRARVVVEKAGGRWPAEFEAATDEYLFRELGLRIGER